MDSKTVNKLIKSDVWPELKENRFEHFTARTAWRFWLNRIDVVNFQSFNSYLAQGLECTTYSFTVNLGCLLMEIPMQIPLIRRNEKLGRLLPAEYECNFRRKLFKTLKQPEYERLDIWFIDGKAITSWKPSTTPELFLAT